VCEPAGNLVKRYLLEDDGAGGLVARNAWQGRELLTTTDERFRPVNLAGGPDGALYVVDFYRGIIQHRIYMTSFLRRQVHRSTASGPSSVGPRRPRAGIGRVVRVRLLSDRACPGSLLWALEMRGYMQTSDGERERVTAPTPSRQPRPNSRAPMTRQSKHCGVTNSGRSRNWTGGSPVWKSRVTNFA